MAEQRLYEKGIERNSKGNAICENILVFTLILFGFLGMYPLKVFNLPLISILYILFAAVMMVFVLRKYLCTNCYYYDNWCHCGWGKLSSALFKKNSGNLDLGGKLALFSWGILMGLPIIVMIIIIILEIVSLSNELIFFVPFILLVMINGFVHKIDCEKCKMRFICPGSAAKNAE